MKIVYIMIISMFSIFVIFTVHSYVTLNVSVQELKNSSGLRNEAQANNIMQGLDKYIEKRINDFKSLSKLKEIRDSLKQSNEQFSHLGNLEFILQKRESELSNPDTVTPFMKNVLQNQVSEDFRKIISFYKSEYNYDVVQELFVTNSYGANVALGSGTSDYIQSDEDWWKISKSDGEYIGQLQYEPDYGQYSIPFAFQITDESGNFLGVMRVSLSVEDVLHDFINDADVVGSAYKHVTLLDDNGRIIYSNGIQITFESNPVNYLGRISGDTGYFELKDNQDSATVVSYARSIGYESFNGFGWIVTVDQDQSTVVNEFNGISNSILTASLIGIAGSVGIGLIISFLVATPLRQLSKMAKRISEGDFSVKVPKSKIDEIGVIDDSFNNMVVSLKKSIETEKELAEARMKIRRERLSAIGELAASMAHDIKNPLATIKTSSEILKRNAKDDKEMNEITARMNRAIDRISHQIEDVLNFVRITPLELKPISIKSVFQSALKSIEIPNNIEVELPAKDLEIDGDQRKLEVVFINLILNSVQAIGNKDGKIIIRLKEKAEEIIIEVEDSGPGIDEDLLPKIFFPLVTTKEKGTGLGLSTCKNIIEQHGGSINVQNKPTTFVIEFPKNLKSPKF